MSLLGRSSPPRSGRAKEITLLALLLSTGVVGFQLGIDALFGRAGGGLAHAPRDMLISVPAALVAAWLGLRIAPRPDSERRPGFAVALNRAALVSLTFMVLFVPSALLGRFFASASITVVPGAFPSEGAIPGLAAQALRSVSDALIGQVLGLPLLLAAFLLPGQARPSPRTTGLRRPSLLVAVGASLAAVAYFVSPGAAAAMAAVPPAASAPSMTTAAANPCASAPHDTFNISAINVDMPLNRYGVHDPNGFMYGRVAGTHCCAPAP
ncbi:MAG: hypothetical protein ACRDPO_20710 [Streptosporangiaceae bacterium]